MRNLFLRYAVAVVAIPVILLILWIGPSWAFNLFTTVIMMAALNEWLNLFRTQKLAAPRILSITMGLVMTGGMWAFSLTNDGLYLYITTTLVMTGICLFGLIDLHHDIKQKVLGNGSITLALLLSCWGGGSLILLREMNSTPDGRFWIVLLFVMVWVGDAGAMHIGKLIGRHKLAPIISPKKTVEGLIGGILISTAMGCFFHHFLHLPIPVWHIGIIAPITVLLAHLGDLTGSIVKRVAGVKDSGKGIPGHGGYLDRFDNLMLTAPFLYLYVRMILG
ncbi:phosphatidate cytidylyltransferase [bacterium]|nr:phosphatidate cytidylyltransferase [candidate division CSSED10-310 bacterium]